MKTKKINILVILYFISGVAFIILHYMNFPSLMLITKALLMPLLALYFAINLNWKFKQFAGIILLSLFFSWWGDILLQFSGDKYFMFGLVSFLLAHIFYIIAFTRTKTKASIIVKNPLLILPFAFYGIGLIWYLYTDLHDMTIPVMVYAVVILFMALMALNRKEKVSNKSFWLVLTGAILFTLSDSLIAINKFAFPFEASRFLIMTLYITAQYLIIEGCLLQLKSNK